MRVSTEQLELQLIARLTPILAKHMHIPSCCYESKAGNECWVSARVERSRFRVKILGRNIDQRQSIQEKLPCEAGREVSENNSHKSLKLLVNLGSKHRQKLGSTTSCWENESVYHHNHGEWRIGRTDKLVSPGERTSGSDRWKPPARHQG